MPEKNNNLSEHLRQILEEQQAVNQHVKELKALEKNEEIVDSLDEILDQGTKTIFEIEILQNQIKSDSEKLELEETDSPS